MNSSLTLKVSIAVHRADPLLWIAAALALAALLCQFLLIPTSNQRYEKLSVALLKLDDLPGSAETRTSATERAISAFNAVLKSRAELPLILEKQFEIARAHRLELGRGEYRLDKDVEGGFSYYRITLPLTGPYSALRPFMESMLAEWPGMALEQLSFSRGHAGEKDTEAVLRFAILVTE